mmetsp:Transcript_11496/g.22882  ORF Transcript_11496/g.22882 Transcript_11496/m.22882 type:complete len:103 (-) Transcript_11496:985-1293(-)
MSARTSSRHETLHLAAVAVPTARWDALLRGRPARHVLALPRRSPVRPLFRAHPLPPTDSTGTGDAAPPRASASPPHVVGADSPPGVRAACSLVGSSAKNTEG